MSSADLLETELESHCVRNEVRARGLAEALWDWLEVYLEPNIFLDLQYGNTVIIPIIRSDGWTPFSSAHSSLLFPLRHLRTTSATLLCGAMPLHPHLTRVARADAPAASLSLLLQCSGAPSASLRRPPSSWPSSATLPLLQPATPGLNFGAGIGGGRRSSAGA